MDSSTEQRIQRAITDLSESHGSSAADATDINVASEINTLSESVIACLALQRNVTRELARRISLLIDAPNWDIVFVDPNDHDSPFGILLVDGPVTLPMVDPSNWPVLDAHIGEQARRHAIAHFFGEDALVRPTGGPRDFASKYCKSI